MNFPLALVLFALTRCVSCRQEYPRIPSNPVEVNDLYQEPNGVNPHRDVPPPAASLDETIVEVEELIKSNPKLPRLTRGEIVDILENITDVQALRVAKLNGKSRTDGQRAIMVVMPFTAGSAQGDIKELYTRAPVTHIIGGGEAPKIGELRPIRRKPLRRKPPSFPNIQVDEDDEGNQSNLIAPASSTTETTTVSETTEATTQKVIGAALTIPEVIFQKHSNHRYTEELPTTFAPESGMHLIDPPSLGHHDDGYSAPYTVKLADLHRKTNQKVSAVRTTIVNDVGIPEEFKSVVDDLEILHKPNFNQIDSLITPPKFERVFAAPPTTTTTTPKPISGVSEVADNLSPDMKDLLMNFGLLEGRPNENPSNSNLAENDEVVFGQKAEITPESYSSFKPLPNDAGARREMDDFLAKFGLGKKSARSQKAIAMDAPVKQHGKNPQVNLDVIPDAYRGVMQDLGFTTRNVKTPGNLITEQPKHVFAPAATRNDTEEELGRLGKLLGMIKDLDKKNRNLTEDDLKNIDVNSLKDLIDSFNAESFVPLDQQEAPNPLNYDYKLVKVDYKRQETTTEEADATTTEEAQNPSLEDLEASFGGLPETRTTTTEAATEAAPTTRRSGFYYLVDWNSIFELDDENGRRVNLRFQPKVGDPKNFRYVTVP